MTIHKQLLSHQDLTYQAFSKKLTPTQYPIIGVRMPIQQSIAKTISQSNWREFLENVSDESFEVVNIQGLVIAYAEMKRGEREYFLQRYLYKIDNWATCDSVCSALKIFQKDAKYTWKFLKPLLKSQYPFEVRFALVSILFHLIDKESLTTIFKAIDAIQSEEYYVRMAQAWLLSMVFVKFPEETWNYFPKSQLDDWTFNKAMQKIMESKQIDKETRFRIRCTKRR